MGVGIVHAPPVWVRMGLLRLLSVLPSVAHSRWVRI